MKQCFIAALLSLCGQLGGAQIVTVIDAETMQPLDVVTIASEDPQAFAITNAKGEANLERFKGAAVIEFRLLGYSVERRSFNEVQTNEFKVQLTASGITIDEVVISASRWSQTSRDIPAKVTSITNRDISLQNPQTAADMLGESGEVFIQKSQQGGGSPIIRGYSTNRLLYTVDGVRMNTAIFRGGNIQNVISLDPFATEHTEVFFGPGSVIYGSDAIGGVMSFQTLLPELAAGAETLITGKAIARYSSANDEKTAHFDINVGGERWSSVTSFSSYDYGDLKMGNNNGPDEYLRNSFVERIDSMDVIVTNDDPLVQKPSGYSQINLMQKLRFRPNLDWDFQYGFHYSETSDYSRYDRLIQTRNGSPRYGEWSYGPQKWMMNNLAVNHSKSNAVYDQMNIRIAQQAFEESRISRNFNSEMRQLRVEQVDAYSLNVDMTKMIADGHTLNYGLEAVINDVHSTGTDENISTGEEQPGPPRYPESTWSSYAAYASYQWKVSDSWLVQAGLRYTQYILDADFDTTFYDLPFNSADINDGALSGTLGVVFRPSESWVLHANVATGFRSPNVDDIGKVFDSEPGAVTVPNPDLMAESVYNAEMGFVKILGDFARIDLTAYYSILENAMVRRDYSINGMDSVLYEGIPSKVQAIQNAARATVYGIQAGVEFDLPLGFGLSSDINYQVGEEELDDGTESPSRHAPPLFGITRLTYRNNGLRMQFYAVYNAARKFEDMPVEEIGKTHIYATDENGNPWSPGWYTLNFKAQYQVNSTFSVSAGLENLTDQRYRPYSSGIVAPGRNFILSGTVRF